jgi:hypothetical protein
MPLRTLELCVGGRVSERRLREEWGVELWLEGEYCARCGGKMRRTSKTFHSKTLKFFNRYLSSWEIVIQSESC